MNLSRRQFLAQAALAPLPKDVNLEVITASPNLRARKCVAAMRSGKHVATKLPAALTIEECWELVETSEKTGKHCVPLAPEIYARENLLILQMVRKGFFGELLDATGAQIGPIARWFGINRGDRFDYLVSMGYNTLIRTADAKTITLYGDLQAPHPPTSELRLHGTGSLYSANIAKISQEDRWRPFEPYYEEYKLPNVEPEKLMWQRLTDALRNNTQPDTNVYDAAAWSVIRPLAEASAAAKSKAVEIPDFTRGKWKTHA